MHPAMIQGQREMRFLRRRAHRRGAILRNVQKISAVLRRNEPTLGKVFDRLGPRGLGLALLLLTLPILVPVPGPAGMIFGALISLVAVQVALGARTLWLPEVIRRLRLPSTTLRNGIARAMPWLRNAERWTCERRLMPLTGLRARMILAVPLFLMGLALMLPIPLGNIAPSIALIAFAFGFMTRDGVTILLASILSLGALVWTGLLFFLGASLLEHVFAIFT